ncbi:MAG: hypothetical protein ACKVS8_12240 [Phycisphaerales bacterium]
MLDFALMSLAALAVEGLAGPPPYWNEAPIPLEPPPYVESPGISGPPPTLSSGWSDDVDGIALQAWLPPAVEAGLRIPLLIEFRASKDRLLPGHAYLALTPPLNRIELLLRPLPAGDEIVIRTDDWGNRLVGKGDFCSLNEPLPRTRHTFAPAARAGELPPGRYQAQVRFIAHRSAWQEPMPPEVAATWTGTTASPAMAFEVLAQPPRFQRLWLPKTLRLELTTDPSPGPRRPRLVPVYSLEEAEPVDIPRRNGCSLALSGITRGHDTGHGGSFIGGEAPEPGRPLDSLVLWRWPGGAKTWTVKLTLFYCCGHIFDIWAPGGRDAPVAWEREFTLTYDGPAFDQSYSPDMSRYLREPLPERTGPK